MSVTSAAASVAASPSLHLSPIFFNKLLQFEEKAIACCIRGDEIDVCQVNDESFAAMTRAMEKIKEINLLELIYCLNIREREVLLDNVLSLRNTVMSKGITKGFFFQARRSFSKKIPASPFLLEITTTKQMNDFTDTICCHLFSLVHDTTYYTAHPDKQRPTQALPTDHVGIKELSEGYQFVICDGLGHAEPKDVGRVAASVVERVLSEPLSNKIMQRKEKNGTNKSAYHKFLEELNRDYHYQEGTTVLEVEVKKKDMSRWEITVCNYGDSALVVLDQQGSIVFSTKDKTKEQCIKHEGPVGMLGVGAGIHASLIENMEYEHLEIDSGWIVACTDGLSATFREPVEGIELDRKRFEVASRLGCYCAPGEILKYPSPLPEEKLSLASLTTNLKAASFDAARKTGEGDDVSIVILSLPNLRG